MHNREQPHYMHNDWVRRVNRLCCHKPWQLLAQEFKGKGLLATLTETVTLGYWESEGDNDTSIDEKLVSVTLQIVRYATQNSSQNAKH